MSQPRHLFGTVEVHQFAGNGALAAVQRGPHVTSNKPNATQNKRFLAHLKQTAQTFPQGVAANIIGFAAIMKAHAELAMRTRADAKFAVMEADFLREGVRLPAFHARGGDGDPVNRADFYRDIAADFLKAFFAKHLTGTGDVGGIGELMRVAVVIEPLVVFHKRCARNTEFRGKLKF